MTSESEVRRSDGQLDELISALGRDLKPVRRLPSPLQTTALFAVAAFVIGFLVELPMREPPLPQNAAAGGMMWMLAAAPLSTALLSALAAFQLSRPDRSPDWALLPVPALLLWLGAVVAEILLRPAGVSFEQAFGDNWLGGLQCFLCITATGVPLTGLVLFLLWRARPLEPGRAALLGGLACAAAGAAILAVVHPHSSTVIDYGAHAAGLAVVVLLGWRLGLVWLRWRTEPIRL